MENETDHELSVMKNIWQLLDSLEGEQMTRVMSWIVGKMIDKANKLEKELKCIESKIEAKEISA
jgi:hypothetical protein